MPIDVGSTSRLRFRAFTDADVPRLFALMDDPRVKRGEPWSPAPNHPSFADRIKDMVKGSALWVSFRPFLCPFSSPFYLPPPFNSHSSSTPLTSTCR
jgi:RimJ/RimL family protein N-acetyltransferase